MSLSLFKKPQLIHQLLLLLVPLFILVSVLVVGQFQRHALRSIEEATSTAMEARNDAAASTIADLEDKALVIATIFANLDFVPTAYRVPDEKAGSERLKNSVTRLIAPIIRGEDPRKFQIHYHKSPARSFLRSWTSKRFDDLSGFRPTILEVNRTHQPLKAIEFGVGGFAIRGLAPVFDGEQYLGSCEFLYDIRQAYDLTSVPSAKREIVFLVKESVVRKSIKPEEIAAHYKRNIGGYFLSAIENDWVDPSMLFDTETGKVRLSGNRDGVFFNAIELRDNYGTPMGYSVSFVDNRALIAHKQREAVTISLAIMMVLLTGFAVIAYFVNRRMIRPIKHATRIAREIAKGNLTELNIEQVS
jgi:methyl-accepting chemotaxis protein